MRRVVLHLAACALLSAPAHAGPAAADGTGTRLTPVFGWRGAHGQSRIALQATVDGEPIERSVTSANHLLAGWSLTSRRAGAKLGVVWSGGFFMGTGDDGDGEGGGSYLRASEHGWFTGLGVSWRSFCLEARYYHGYLNVSGEVRGASDDIALTAPNSSRHTGAARLEYRGIEPLHVAVEVAAEHVRLHPRDDWYDPGSGDGARLRLGEDATCLALLVAVDLGRLAGR